MNNIDGLRLRLSDQWKNVSESVGADGLQSVFDLTHYPLRSGTAYCSVYADSILQTAVTNYSLSYDDGRLTMVNAPPSGAVVQVYGKKSVFSDTELTQVLTDHGLATASAVGSMGALDSTVLTCVEILFGDAWRRHNWGAAGGQNVSEGQLMANLKTWRDTLINKVRGTEVGPQGGWVAQSDTQSDYGDPYSEP